MATGSELFSLLTCLVTTNFILLSICPPLEMISFNIWETKLSWHAKCSFPDTVHGSKTSIVCLNYLSGFCSSPKHIIYFIYLDHPRWLINRRRRQNEASYHILTSSGICYGTKQALKYMYSIPARGNARNSAPAWEDDA